MQIEQAGRTHCAHTLSRRRDGKLNQDIQSRKRPELAGLFSSAKNEPLFSSFSLRLDE
jgi:hypothetical protein